MIIHYLKVIALPLLCLAWVSIISAFILGTSYHSPILLASMGAAAVIMFSTPQSPLATFRAFILGNLLSAAVGVSCRRELLPINRPPYTYWPSSCRFGDRPDANL